MEKQLSVCFLDVAGMACNGDTYKTKGLGGSESAYVYLSEIFSQDFGWNITIYNRCDEPGIYAGVKYLDLSQAPQDTNTYDVLIVSRSVLPFLPERYYQECRNNYGFDPEPYKNLIKNSHYKVLWLHDTFIRGDSHLEHAVLDGLIDEVFTLSDWHTHYITKSQHEGYPRRFEQLKHKMFVTRNGIKNHVDFVDVRAKNPNLYIYNASISKGLHEVVKEVWPEVRKLNPNAELICIGGYYMLAKDYVDGWTKEWRELYENYNNRNGITFTGIIPQHEIARIYKKATYMLYPACFPETFGISTLEAINYNVLPIVHRFGALEEIAPQECCYITEYGFNEVPGLNKEDSKRFQLPRMMQQVYKAFSDPYLRQQKQYACNKFKPWIGWDKVAIEWKEHLFNKLGLYLSPLTRIAAREATYNYLRLFNRTNINREAKIMDRFIGGLERKIYVITPVFNAEKYIANNILSVANQLYDNYEHIIVDDVSTDNTVEVIENTLNLLPKEIASRFYLIKNEEKNYAVGNHVYVLDSLKDRDSDINNAIILLLDGDDWLVNNPDIFTYINSLYNKGIKFTYGSCHSLADNINLYAQEYPPEVKINKSYREYLFNWGMPYTHLRTFSFDLYTKFNADDEVFDEKGETKYRAGGDNYLFYRLIEQCEPEEIMAVGDILVEYNDINPLNDYKVNKQEQTETATLFRQATTQESPQIEVARESSSIDMCNLAQVEEIKNNIVDKVRQKDPEAIKIYKKLAIERVDIWDEDPNSLFVVPRFQWVKEYLLTNFPNKDINIIDVGAWTGTFAQLIYDLGYHNITCLDINPNVVEFGKKLRPYFRWGVGDIEDFTLYDKYDVILMCEVAEHLIEPIKTIKRLAQQSLTTNGVILYSIPTEVVVFGDKLHNNSNEHVTKITAQQLEPISDTFEVIYSSTDIANAYEWYVGAVKQSYVHIENTNDVKTILIAIPTQEGIKAETFKSIFNLTRPPNTKVVFQYFFGYNIAQIRNLIAHWSVNNHFDYVFHVDSDIILPSDALVKLYNRQLPIVGGIYRQRKDENILEVYEWAENGGMKNVKPEALIDTNLMKVAGCGFGCVLVDTNVYRKIPYPQFVYHSAILMQNTLSEDLDFCIKAKDHNIDIFVDPTIRCGHIGTRVFNI